VEHRWLVERRRKAVALMRIRMSAWRTMSKFFEEGRDNLDGRISRSLPDGRIEHFTSCGSSSLREET
jgi:hypothetical protein